MVGVRAGRCQTSQEERQCPTTRVVLQNAELPHCFISEKGRGVFSSYRSHIRLKLSKMLRSQRERWMSSAHRSLGSLGNRAHRSNKRNQEIKTTMSRVISSISPGFVQALCDVGKGSGAQQGHLPGCPGVCRSIPVPSTGGWHCLLWGWCVYEATLHHFHSQGRCPWAWGRAVPLF